MENLADIYETQISDFGQKVTILSIYLFRYTRNFILYQ